MIQMLRDLSLVPGLRLRKILHFVKVFLVRDPNMSIRVFPGFSKTRVIFWLVHTVGSNPSHITMHLCRVSHDWQWLMHACLTWREG